MDRYFGGRYIDHAKTFGLTALLTTGCGLWTLTSKYMIKETIERILEYGYTTDSIETLFFFGMTGLVTGLATLVGAWEGISELGNLRETISIHKSPIIYPENMEN